MPDPSPTPRVVWKFALPVWPGIFQLNVPAGAQPLCVHLQGGSPHLWMLVDSAAQPYSKRFYCAMTGSTSFDLDGRYLGTALIDDGAYVLHYFEAP